MDTIWKIIITGIVIIGIAATGIGITMGNADVTTANNYFQEISNIIIESNYSDSVIQECIDEAAENGYDLRVTVHGTSTPGTKKYAEAVFEYTYKIPIINVEDSKTKRKIL